MKKLLGNFIEDIKNDNNYKQFLIALRDNNLKEIKNAIINSPNERDFFEFSKLLFKDFNFDSNKKNILKLFFKNYSVGSNLKSERFINCIILLGKMYSIKNDDILNDILFSIILGKQRFHNKIIIISGIIFLTLYENLEFKNEFLNNILQEFHVYYYREYDFSFFIFLPLIYKIILLDNWRKNNNKNEFYDLKKYEEEEAIGIKIHSEQIKKMTNFELFKKDVTFLLNFIKNLLPKFGMPIEKVNIVKGLKNIFLKSKKHNWVIYQIGHGSEKSISGLKFIEYSEELKFFNKELSIFMFLNVSCNTTGINLFKIYEGYNKLSQIKTNYIIIHVGTGDVSIKKIIEINHFFEYVMKKLKKRKISYKELNDLLKFEGLTFSIPFVRFEKQDYFIPIEPKKERKIKLITHIKSLIKEFDNSNFNFKDLNGVIFSINRIYPKVVFQSIISVFSIYPGNGIHFFREIETKVGIFEFVTQYIFNPNFDKDLSSFKIFIIKKLISKSIFENCYISIPDEILYFELDGKGSFNIYKNQKFITLTNKNIFVEMQNTFKKYNNMNKIEDQFLYVSKVKKFPLPFIYGEEEYRWDLFLISKLKFSNWDILWAKLKFLNDEKKIQKILSIKTVYEKLKGKIENSSLEEKVNVILKDSELEYFIINYIQISVFKHLIFRKMNFQSILLQKMKIISKEELKKNIENFYLENVKFINEVLETPKFFNITVYLESILKIKENEKHIAKKYLEIILKNNTSKRNLKKILIERIIKYKKNLLGLL